MYSAEELRQISNKSSELETENIIQTLKEEMHSIAKEGYSFMTLDVPDYVNKKKIGAFIVELRELGFRVAVKPGDKMESKEDMLFVGWESEV